MKTWFSGFRIDHAFQALWRTAQNLSLIISIASLVVAYWAYGAAQNTLEFQREIARQETQILLTPRLVDGGMTIQPSDRRMHIVRLIAFTPRGILEGIFPPESPMTELFGTLIIMNESFIPDQLLNDHL